MAGRRSGSQAIAHGGHRQTPAARTRQALIASLLTVASLAAAEEIVNRTGLPVYPYLTKAAMDPVARTDGLGRWCRRFSAETSYSLDTVQTWYRKILVGASETDLSQDPTYKGYPKLSGIKLALGRNYVTVYKITNQSATSIELFGCSPPGRSE